MLEAQLHKSSVCMTLTYEDVFLPKDHSVSVEHLQQFFKRLRHFQQFRYYAVGEYGEQTLRPHYHICVFNFPQCFRGKTDLTKKWCCDTCERVKKDWGKGAIEIQPLEPAAAAYVAGYVTKKIQAMPLPKNLRPEFQRMSLRPGLGYYVMHDVAATLNQYDMSDQIDVPMNLQHGKDKMPLGRYLRGKLRIMTGREDKCPEEIMEQQREKMRPLREDSFNNSKNFKEEIIKASKGKRLNLLARTKIKSGRKSL